jgi:hypothetical protein
MRSSPIVHAFALVASVALCACNGNSPNSSAPPVIQSFTATPAVLPLDGGSGTSSLAWQVTGAQSLSIDQDVGNVTPVNAGSVSVQPDAGTTAYTLTATNPAGSVTQTTSVCVDQPVTLSVDTPSLYLCDAGYTAAFTVNNGSCAAVTVSSVEVSAVITGSINGSNCAPPSPFSYPATTRTVPAGQQVKVLDVQTAPFCCSPGACPSGYGCDQQYTFVADTSAGPLDAGAAVMLSLSSCNIVCQ